MINNLDNALYKKTLKGAKNDFNKRLSTARYKSKLYSVKQANELLAFTEYGFK